MKRLIQSQRNLQPSYFDGQASTKIQLPDARLPVLQRFTRLIWFAAQEVMKPTSDSSLFFWFVPITTYYSLNWDLGFICSSTTEFPVSTLISRLQVTLIAAKESAKIGCYVYKPYCISYPHCRLLCIDLTMRLFCWEKWQASLTISYLFHSLTYYYCTEIYNCKGATRC